MSNREYTPGGFPPDAAGQAGQEAGLSLPEAERARALVSRGRTLNVGRTSGVGGPPPLRSVLEAWQPDLPEGAVMHVDASGRLVVRTGGAVHARSAGLSVLTGPRYATTVRRRTRGRQLDEVLGDAEPILHFAGPVGAVIVPPRDQCFSAVQLHEDLLYVREPHVAAFDDRVGFENGALPVGRETLQLLQFHGSGVVVLRGQRAPMTWPVGDEQLVVVAIDRLLGWAGRLFPVSSQEGQWQLQQVGEGLVGFRGEGHLLLG